LIDLAGIHRRSEVLFKKSPMPPLHTTPSMDSTFS